MIPGGDRLKRIDRSDGSGCVGLTTPDRLDAPLGHDVHARDITLKWMPRISLEEGLRRTIAWFAATTLPDPQAPVRDAP